MQDHPRFARKYLSTLRGSEPRARSSQAPRSTPEHGHHVPSSKRRSDVKDGKIKSPEMLTNDTCDRSPHFKGLYARNARVNV